MTSKNSFPLTLNRRAIQHHTSGTQIQVIQFKSWVGAQKKKFKPLQGPLIIFYFGLKLIAYLHFVFFFTGCIRCFSAFRTQNFCKINKNLRTRSQQFFSEIHPLCASISAVVQCSLHWNMSSSM